MGVKQAATAKMFLLAGFLLAVPKDPGFAALMTVGNLTDSVVDGDGCSLREAISNANNDDNTVSTECPAGSGVDAIDFGVSGTILLSAVLPAITDTDMLTIDGSGQAVTLSGHNAVAVMLVSASGVLRLRNLEITQGSAAGSAGGGVNNSGSLTVERVTFSGNQANSGGAIFNQGTLTATDTTFSGNTGTIAGGGIVNSGAGTAAITRCTFSGNIGVLGGGGIYTEIAGALTVASSTFSGNSASSGLGSGGAIYRNGGQAVTITNSTFSGNQAGTTGSGISNGSGSLTITDSIVANGVTSANCGGTGVVTDGGGNLTWPEADQSCPGALGDPMLLPLGDNGGFTETFELQEGSAARDSAAVIFCPFADQRGVTRPQGEDCDIGAVEGLEMPGLIFWGDFEIGNFSGWSTIVP